jgi:hypothetical protein
MGRRRGRFGTGWCCDDGVGQGNATANTGVLRFAQDDGDLLERVRDVRPQSLRLRGLVVFALGVGKGVVAFAGLDLLAGLAGQVEGAEGSVDLGVGGGEAGEVLGT